MSCRSGSTDAQPGSALYPKYASPPGRSFDDANAPSAFRFAGAWRWIYAVTMGIAVYLNFFVLVTQLFLKVGFLHALAPNAPDNPEPPFLIAQVIVLAIFVWLIWKSVKNFRVSAT